MMPLYNNNVFGLYAGLAIAVLIGMGFGFVLERAGFDTGYDLDALIDTARWIGQRIGRPTPSALSRAGGWPA
jgi:hypothetical protein